MLTGLLGGAGGPSGECGARLTRLAAPLASAVPAQSGPAPPARLCRLWRHRRGDIHRRGNLCVCKCVYCIVYLYSICALSIRSLRPREMQALPPYYRLPKGTDISCTGLLH